MLKGRVSRLEAHLEFIYRHLGISFIDDPQPDDNPKVIEALKANNMLEAIKQYRIATNTSLEAAKLAIEEMRSRLGI